MSHKRQSYLNGAYANYSDDAASRLLVLDNQTNNGQHQYAYTYDYVGNRLEMTVTNAGGVGIHLYSYDNIYQITEVNYPDSLSYLATDPEFNYDAAGNRSSVIDGSGTCTYTSNNLNQYTAAGPTNFSYDSSGNMTHDANYGYAYDPENRLIQVTKSGGDPPDALAEALDCGLSFITDGNNGGWSTEGGTWCRQDWDCASGSTCDEGEDWLQTTVQGAGTLKFWWKVSSETWDVLEFYIDDDCKDSISGEQAWAEKTYTISGAGTHTLKWRYAKDGSEYAGEDRGWVDYVQWTGAMEEPDPNEWSTLNYVYDPAGRRVEKKYDGRTVLKYVYDGDHCIAEYDSGNNLKRKYVYGPAVDEPIAMIESSGSYAGTYYYHFDALGSVVALTDSDADTVNAYEYDVYGRVGMLDANHPNRLLFTGREYDKETGLYYYRARYYNPQIGRFLQTDPLGYAPGMNSYTYCLNGPLTLIDPTGLVAVYGFSLKSVSLGEGKYKLDMESRRLRGDIVTEGDVSGASGWDFLVYVDGVGGMEQALDFAQALIDIHGLETGRKLLNEFAGKQLGVKVTITDLPALVGGVTNPETGEITWDSDNICAKMVGIDAAVWYAPDAYKILPSALTLAEELIHYWQFFMQGIPAEAPEGVDPDEWHDYVEDRAKGEGGTVASDSYTVLQLRKEWRGAERGTWIWWTPNEEGPNGQGAGWIRIPMLPEERKK